MPMPATVGRVGLLGLLLMAVLMPSAIAATQDSPRDKFRSGGEVTIGADQTVPHDLYIGAGRVQIDGTVQGDLIVAGGDVDLNGRIEGDLLAAGGSVTLRGPVAGDVRVAGGNVRLESTVGKDVLATAGMLTIAAAAEVGQDLIFAARETTLNGRVGGDVLGRTGDYGAGGTITGGEDVTVDVDEGPTLLERILSQLRRYLSILLLGVLLLWLAPRLLGTATRLLRERPLLSVGVGLLTVAIVALVLIVLVLTIVVMALVLGVLGFGALLATAIVGLLLAGGVLGFLFAIAAYYLADAVVGLTLGRLLLDRIEGTRVGRPIWALLIGVLIVVVLTALPVIGGVLHVIAALFGLGALAWSLWRRGRTPQVATA